MIHRDNAQKVIERWLCQHEAESIPLGIPHRELSREENE